MLLGRVVPGQLGGGLAHLLGLALEGRALLLGSLALGCLLGLEALVGGLEALDQIPRLDLVLLVRVLRVTGLARPDLNRLIGLEAMVTCSPESICCFMRSLRNTSQE